MKEIFTNLALFVVLAIAFSGLSACKETPVSSSNSNAANKPANTTAQTGDTKSTVYPPLPSGIADAEIELVDGTITKPSEHKGKVLILNLWGIWCGPCRDEMPHLAQLQTAYGERGFEVMGLNIGDNNMAPEDLGKIKAFTESMKLNYTIGRIKEATTNQFYILSRQQAVPQTLLVDRDGRLRGVFVGGGPSVIDKLTKSVDALMSEGQ